MSYSKLIIPIGFLLGQPAIEAVEAKLALTFVGKKQAFTLARIVYRDDSKEKLMSAAELLKSEDAEIKQQLASICAVRAPICNLDMNEPHIMGIINITPDSFSDGGLQSNLKALEMKIDACIEKGVSIIDIGGESTRPNAPYVSCNDEIARLKPLLALLNKKNVCVSCDTRKAKVMAYALENGADIINDVSALEFESNVVEHGEVSGDSLALMLKKRTPVILMHAKGTPDIMQDDPIYDNILFEIYDYLKQRIEVLTSAGYALENIIVDPGIGFGKKLEHNLTIIKNIALFHSLGTAILVGASRKAFIGVITGEDNAKDRLGGSLAIANICMNMGVQINRMHDIKQALEQNLIIATFGGQK